MRIGYKVIISLGLRKQLSTLRFCLTLIFLGSFLFLCAGCIVLTTTTRSGVKDSQNNHFNTSGITFLVFSHNDQIVETTLFLGVLPIQIKRSNPTGLPNYKIILSIARYEPGFVFYPASAVLSVDGQKYYPKRSIIYSDSKAEEIDFTQEILLMKSNTSIDLIFDIPIPDPRQEISLDLANAVRNKIGGQGPEIQFDKSIKRKLQCWDVRRWFPLE